MTSIVLPRYYITRGVCICSTARTPINVRRFRWFPPYLILRRMQIDRVNQQSIVHCTTEATSKCGNQQTYMLMDLTLVVALLV